MRATGPPRSHPHQYLRLDRSGSPRGCGTCFDPLRPASVSLPPSPPPPRGEEFSLAKKRGAGSGQRFPWARYISIQLHNIEVIQRSSEARRSSTAAVRENTPRASGVPAQSLASAHPENWAPPGFVRLCFVWLCRGVSVGCHSLGTA